MQPGTSAVSPTSARRSAPRQPHNCNYRIHADAEPKQHALPHTGHYPFQQRTRTRTRTPPTPLCNTNTAATPSNAIRRIKPKTHPPPTPPNLAALKTAALSPPSPHHARNARHSAARKRKWRMVIPHKRLCPPLQHRTVTFGTTRTAYRSLLRGASGARGLALGGRCGVMWRVGRFGA